MTLTERLRSGTGANTPLDLALCDHFGLFYSLSSWAKLTSDLNAVFALVERELPGVFIELSGPRKYLNIPTPVPARYKVDLMTDTIPAKHFGAWHDDRCRALLLALLAAREGK